MAHFEGIMTFTEPRHLWNNPDQQFGLRAQQGTDMATKICEGMSSSTRIDWPVQCDRTSFGISSRNLGTGGLSDLVFESRSR